MIFQEDVKLLELEEKGKKKVEESCPSKEKVIRKEKEEAKEADNPTDTPAGALEEIVDTRAKATVTRVDTEDMEAIVATVIERYERAGAFD